MHDKRFRNKKDIGNDFSLVCLIEIYCISTIVGFLIPNIQIY